METEESDPGDGISLFSQQLPWITAYRLMRNTRDIFIRSTLGEIWHES